MATEARLYYSASCDVCGYAFIDDDNDGTILGETPEQVTGWAVQAGWIVHRGLFRCGEGDCLNELAVVEHDFMTKPSVEPFCVICKQLANGHPNVPVVGQTEIAIPADAQGGHSG